MKTVLLICPQEDDANDLYGFLTHEALNRDVVPVSSGAFALEALDAGCRPVAVLCASVLPGEDFVQITHLLRERLPGVLILPVVSDETPFAWAGERLERPFGLERLKAALEGKK